jgi:hypothetical protein
MPQSALRLEELRICVDARQGIFRELRRAPDLASYLETQGDRADEEILTEPLLAAILERVLGFPPDGYFPQLGRSGQKPDFTPIDLIAHSFVLDAKGSDENLAHHEPQIRRYVSQRSLDFGVLFNLREVRVYRRGGREHDRALSFPVLPLWRVARGEAIPGPEVRAFDAFCELFSYRKLGLPDKIRYVRDQRPWSLRLAGGEAVEVDVEFLVQRLRTLSRRLADDALAQVDALDRFLAFNPGREKRLLDEFELLALDIAPGTDIERLPRELHEWRSDSDLAGRAWRQYLLRVAYLALIRILLYRAWEDVEFVDSYLFDGGFGDWYDRLSSDLGRVLEEAFKHGGDRYHWLYGRDNNYDWYRPREAALIDVLYSLAPVPLGKLDTDVLGSLYESYAEEIDRARLGQFFTPRPVIRFMLDRAEFAGPDGVFRVEGDERSPKRVLDFATGSGGFLVEAARRIIDEGGVDLDSPREIEEALRAIVNGFVGGEISPFPYYLTEVNLLLQVSRLLGRLTLAGQRPPDFALGALHVDTLSAKSSPHASLDVDPSLRADRAELVANEWFDLVPLDGEKRERYRSLREDGCFELVIGNPPYVTEANNKILFDRLRDIAAWKGIYRGKTDYLYYFLVLAVEKLAPGGRLCVITPAGWMNAGAADFLREKLAGELRLDELFLFGSYRLFAPEHGERLPTPTVESAILVATKAPARVGHKLRVVALEDEADAARTLSGDPAARSPDRTPLLEEMEKRARGRPGRKGGIHVLDVLQADLLPERPWPVKWSAADVASRVVAHLEAMLADEAAPVEPLERAWRVFQGIQTGADAYSPRVWKRLPAATRERLATAGARNGDPIMELPPGWETQSPWAEHMDLLCRSPESRAVLYAAVDDEDYVHLVRIDRGHTPPDSVIAALDRWRPVLANRAEILRNPKRRWWETAWPRDWSDLSKPKIIALYRTDRGRFALDEEGAWRPSIKLTLVVGRSDTAPVAYLCGVLNSELLDLWYAVRGKTPWHVRRNYEPKRMNEIPYRRPEGDPRAERVAELVREIAANRRALLPHRSLVPELGRLVKDPWKTGPVALDRAALVGELSIAETISVRLDPALNLAIARSPVGRPVRAGATKLVFRRGRVETAYVTGPKDRLDLLEEVLGTKPPADLPAVLLPRDLDRFDALATRRLETVSNLLAGGRSLVEEVERLVCALYEVPSRLTEEVIAHAARRATPAN